MGILVSGAWKDNGLMDKGGINGSVSGKLNGRKWLQPSESFSSSV